ncbi:MBOAT family O-acyltransferase [Anaeromicrobium sediminis]|uniref:Membrane-bound O-acyltransferase family protein n=1 Tax=Anaeromicrobium sediminis TaxID=1478221 RepID=A0A267MFM7_9FIRM|nr:MBOAT family O-acyltransferase [Anaeromicrobium sediminis]PAB58267.1 membrane-bound O-acyltransferase family protein [Anaeromicrobium sediminis]
MLFNSIDFLIFFMIVIPLYFILPFKHRWILLLASSYYFYMSWNPIYIVLIIFSTIVDYFASIKMSQVEEKKKRKKYLFFSLATNLGLLFVFKYFNFFSVTTANMLNYTGIHIQPYRINLLLPVGISFYTFQTLSYTIDVYNGKTKAERHFGIFALYVSFFPQLVAGPIERSNHLLPQFHRNYKFDYDRVKSGLMLMLWGFFKKVVIADRLALLVNTVYNNPENYQGFPLILATVFFTFQIYCDFSAYSDIAIGCARVMGFDLMKNFDRPYFSKSIKEFWARWHISLSTWFRDYVYIPLGGNRVKLNRNLMNLFITFTISGLWHGASLTFVVWGMLHGTYLIVEKLTEDFREKIIDLLKINKESFSFKLFNCVKTFILVNLAWVFFRANSIKDAMYIIKNMFKINLFNQIQFIEELYNLGLDKQEFWLAITSIIFLLFIHWTQRKNSLGSRINREPLVARWIVYYGLLFAIIIFGVYGGYDESQFIYFQF